MPRRILIVEDEPVLAKHMQTYFRYHSHGASDVRTAPDATQALEILETFVPDALVMDYGLPDMDGLRLYAEITRRKAKKINCVMITGNPTEQLAEEARDMGIHNIVCKPFRFILLQRVLEALDTAAAGRASGANK